jgi:hypothetical protein
VFDFGVPVDIEDGKTLVETLTDVTWRYRGRDMTLKEEIVNHESVYSVWQTVGMVEEKLAEAGTFDLRRGVLTLSGLFADADTTLTLIVPTKHNDFTSTRNKLLSIDPTLSQITATPATQANKTSLFSKKR